MIEWTAVILAGGRGSRLGGIDKTALLAGGRSLLEHALAAAAGAQGVVVVGPVAPAGIRAVLEEPRFGGPVAAVAAGVAALPPAPFTALLAADQPGIEEAVPRLLAAVEEQSGSDGWLATDPAGRRQFLLGVHRTSALVGALAALTRDSAVAGASMRALLAPLAITEVPLPDTLCADIDTPEDARRSGIRVAAGTGGRG